VLSLLHQLGSCLFVPMQTTAIRCVRLPQPAVESMNRYDKKSATSRMAMVLLCETSRDRMVGIDAKDFMLIELSYS
jgi:aspartate/methionine/tyrosine aminotransferase